MHPDTRIFVQLQRDQRVTDRCAFPVATDMLETVQAAIGTYTAWLRLALETIGGLLIALGAVLSLMGIVRRVRHDREPEFTVDRLVLARALSLALEFQLASDVLGTAMSPEWRQIGQLAAIATIRTLLNIALTREIADDRRRRISSPGQRDS
jgi:uncharacterized membrane protein